MWSGEIFLRNFLPYPPPNIPGLRGGGCVYNRLYTGDDLKILGSSPAMGYLGRGPKSLLAIRRHGADPLHHHGHQDVEGAKVQPRG